MNSKNKVTTEQDITELVRRFYERAAADQSLQAIFNAVIHDWELHHQVVADFWSHTLLGTGRYHGTPYPVHAVLPVKPEHFNSWLTLFRETARETLPADSADMAIAKAEHMAESFKAGMFSVFNGANGPSRAYPAK